MALIKCPDCDKEVSSNAPTCPSCGSPISDAKGAKAAGATLTTTQETSKKFKLQSLISLALFFGGMIAAVVMAPVEGAAPSGSTAIVPGLMMTVGLIWYLVNRYRIWWHHK